MAQRNIDFGAFPDDPDADAIRSAFEKVQLNFTEVFAGLGDQAVVSVNKTAGPGIYLVNGSPVGNVVLGANIACVQFSSTTLSVGRSPGTGPGSATITDSTQTLYIDLPNTIANITDVVVSGNVQGNTVIGNLSGDFGYVLANTSSGNGNINANNITLTGALAASNVSGNGAGLSAIAGSNITGQVANALVAGTVYTAAQPNITSTGTLTTLDVQSTVTAVNFTANTGLFTGDGGGLSNIVGANVTGEVTNSASANSVAGANVSGEVAFSAVSNSVAGSNVTGAVSFATTANAVAGANVSGEVTNAATANAVAGANVSGEVAFAAVANSVAGANVTGEVAFAQVSNSVAGANVTGQVSFAGTANSVAGSNVSGVVANATHAISSDSANSVSGSNVTGEVSFAATANAVAGGNVSGQVGFAGVANSVAGSNVSGEVAFAQVANSVAGANITGTVANATYADTSGTVETAAQPNITSTGTLTSLNVSGNIDAGNVTTTGVFTGDGGGLSNISVSTGSYIENGTSEARLDTNGPFRVTVGGTANVLQVNNTGTEVTVTGSMSVSGGFDNNINFNSTSNLGPVGNVTVTGGVNGAFLQTDGAGTLTWDTATLVPAQGTDTQVIFNDGGSTYAGNTGFVFNKTTGNLDVPGNISSGGKVSGTTIGGSLVTNAQPNITSVGTLTSLILGGSFNTNSDVITNAGNIEISAGTGSFKGNGAGLTNITGANVSEVPLATLATTATTANAVAGANVTGQVSFAATANAVTGGNVSGEVGFASVANSVSGSNVVGAVSSATTATTAQTVTTAAQPNITSVGTLTGLDVNGLITAVNITANTGLISGDGGGLSNIVGSNVSGAVSSATVATSATTAGTVTTAAQPNITSVGALTSLTVTGNVSVGNISATRGTFTSVSGDGANLTNITGSNVGGQVGFAAIANNVAGGNVTGVVANSTYAASAGSAPLAGTVTTAAQPNITSVSSFLFHSSSDSVSASGSSQGDAFTLTTEINRVTSASASNGIKLPVAQGGLVVFIINTVSNSFKVYPNTSDEINSLGTNNAFTHPEGATLQYICTNSTNWYTVGATYA